MGLIFVAIQAYENIPSLISYHAQVCCGLTFSSFPCHNWLWAFCLLWWATTSILINNVRNGCKLSRRGLG